MWDSAEEVKVIAYRYSHYFKTFYFRLPDHVSNVAEIFIHM